ncbi:DUF805 domain-containing protein [bacterium]|nr:DUF805 domain-containing protein [bacterium]
MEYYLKALKNYANFSGRARRKEYWLFTLWNIVIYFVLLILGAMGGFLPEGAEVALGGLYMLAVFIPGLAVFVRRMHDTGRSGWWFLLNFVPFGAIVVIVFLAQDSNPDANKYGENPKKSAT